MSSFGQKMRCGSGQLGFIAGTFTCYSLHCGNIIHRTNSFCPFRSSFFKVHTPFCASFRHQGMCKASLSSSPFSDSAEPDHELKANEHFNLHWMGILATFLVMLPETADASSLDTLKDIFKSKPASLLHPLVMLGVLGTSLYTFYLGYQSRRLREVDSETRKELVRGRYGQRHYQTSAILLAVLTFFTFEGMANTFTRTGKLFPGPHLYAGLGAVTVMSIMASLAPFMQQGKMSARNVHFALAFVAVGLIGSQLQSGYHILARLLGWE